MTAFDIEHRHAATAKWVATATLALALAITAGFALPATGARAQIATTTPATTTPVANDPNSVDRRPASLALRSDSRLGSADSVYDDPSWPQRRNKRVKLLGGQVARIDDEGGLRTVKSHFSSTSIADVSMYRLIYKLNRDPALSKKHRDDVRASFTVGRTTFHDGYGWGPFLGPFTVATGPGRPRCFVKYFVLPNDPAFAPGQQFTGTLNFSRTHQRLRLTAPITSGTYLSNQPVDLDAARALGCPVEPAENGYGASIARPFGGISPASLVVPRKRKSANGG